MAFLLVGFGVGFAAVYPWMRDRAPEIARTLPQFVPRSVGAPAPPPLDPAVVAQLEGRIESNPRDFDALRELGNLQYDQLNYSKAAEWYAKALEVRPNDVDVRNDRGGALFSAGRTDEAFVEFEKCLSLNPNHPQSLMNYGLALLKVKDDRAGALKLWKRLVEANPDFPRVDLVKEMIEELENAPKQEQ